jgi:DNA-binding HxlR family transcriptional regulator
VKQKNDVSPTVCESVEAAFNLLGRKWAGLVVHVLAQRSLHFSELEDAIPGVSARVLTERIRDLEEAGVVTRTVSAGPPVRVFYALSDKGRALVPVMAGIEKWARDWEGRGENGRAPRATGAPHGADAGRLQARPVSRGRE